MIEIKPIKSIKLDDIKSMGFNGYRTNKIYLINQINEGSSIKIEIKNHKLNEDYTKEWKDPKSSMKYFEDIINQGYSLGVYKDKKLIGFSLMSYYGWNNSMWIENIRISEKHQGKSIGKKLIKEIKKISKRKKARILGLETQSTNYPAIQFYKSCGFSISGVDFVRYPQRENDLEQVAILMKIDIF